MKQKNTSIKVSDFIFDFLYKKDVKDAFILSGGGNIHLVDSIGRSKINYVCNYHEQACATAAEAYARITGNIGVCIVTTGPGGTNAITGVLGSWLDSIPMLIISGQVKRELIGSGTKLGVRQLGVQEINIVDIVKPMTKYAVTVINPEDIQFELEKAFYIATTGRPGPVWLDIPIDVQGAMVEEKKLTSFDLSKHTDKNSGKKQLTELVKKTLARLSSSERPVLYAGHGIRLAGAEKEFLELVDLL